MADKPKIARLLQMKMHDRQVNFIPAQNVLTKCSITTAYFLPYETVVSLSYKQNDEEIHCRMEKDGLTFILPNDFPNLQFVVKSEKAPGKPYTPAVVVEGSPSRKRQKIDLDLELLPLDPDVTSRISQYAWFYTKEGDNIKRSAIPVKRNLAVTFRHGVNESLKIGDSIKLLSYQNVGKVVETRVVLVDDNLDLIILMSESAELCDRDLIMKAVEGKKGMKYILMGYPAVDSKISFSTGIISSGVSSRSRFLGSDDSAEDNSGGSCWSEDGRLIGMQVGTRKELCGRCGILSSPRIFIELVQFLPSEVIIYHEGE